MCWPPDDARPRQARWRMLLATMLLVAVAAAAGALAAWDDRREIEARAVGLTGGDPHAGREAIAYYGCGACHIVPGVQRAQGLVGPPLTAFGRRIYVAGKLQNTPENLIHWILAPQNVSPFTAMPDTGVTEDDARNIAAYLYTLR